MASATVTFAALLSGDCKAVAEGLRRRDPDLLDHLIGQYEHRLFRYLLYLTGSRETAEDVFQETWIRVLDRGHQYDGRSEFATWLFSIARHLVIDLQRRKPAESLDQAADLPAGLPSALDLATNRQEQSNLYGALGRLPALFREVLVLRFQEDMPIEEIAAVLGTPVSTVKSRLYRGLEALRVEFSGGGQ